MGNKPDRDWVPYNSRDELVRAMRQIEDYENALKQISEGTTPWMDCTDKASASWEALASFAKQTLDTWVPEK